MKDFDNRLNVAWWALRIGLGVGPIITGIDKCSAAMPAICAPGCSPRRRNARREYL